MEGVGQGAGIYAELEGLASETREWETLKQFLNRMRIPYYLQHLKIKIDPY